MNKKTGASRQSTPVNGQLKAYFAGLASGLFLAFLGNLLDIHPQKFMGGEKKSADKNNAKVETVRSGTKFDFYTVLPEQEVVIAEPPPASADPGTAPATATVPGTVPPPAIIEKPDTTTAPITNLSAPAENVAAIKQAEQLAAQSAVAKPKSATYLQVGSFRRNEDADKRRAELLMYGFRAGVDSVSSNGENWYRVQIGPFASDTEMSRARAKLKENGIDTLMTRKK